MKIRYLGNREGKEISIKNGDEANVSDAKAKRLVDGGYAEYVDSPRKSPKVVTTDISKSSTKKKKK